MQIRKLLTEDRAASPVIGVILMVAIVVILAAVIGTFVLGLGDRVQEDAPKASFSISGGNSYLGNDGAYNKEGITITHEGGDAIPTSELQITIGGQEFLNESGGINGSGGAIDDIEGLFDPGVGGSEAQNPSDPWTSGDSYVFVENTDVYPDVFDDGDEVRIIWQAPNSDKTATLFKKKVSTSG